MTKIFNSAGITKTVFTGFCVGLCVIIACHALFLQMGTWHVDEYDYMYSLETQGIWFSLKRWLIWSPRPLAELLTFLYARLVLITRFPLTGYVLGAMWLLFFALAFKTFLQNAPKGSTGFACLFSLLICVLYLLGHPVADLYYWPMATFAYLPTLGSITALFLLCFLERVSERKKQRIEFILLLIGLASSESGMIFASLYAGFKIILCQNTKGMAFLREKAFWNLVVIIGLAGGLLVLVKIGRVPTEQSSSIDIKGDWIGSLRYTLPAFYQTFLAVQPKELAFGTVTLKDVWLGMALKPLLFLGFFLLFLFRGWVFSAREMLGVLLALMGTVFLTLYFTYYVFGALMTQRYLSFQMDLVVLSVAGFAALAAKGVLFLWQKKVVVENCRRVSHLLLGGGLVVLAVCIGIMFSWRFPALQRAYALYPEYRQNQQELWQTKGEKIIFKQCGFTPLTYSWVWEPGYFSLDHPPHSGDKKLEMSFLHSRPVMLFFHKKEMVIFSPFFHKDCPVQK
ncbi:hypothetical protein [Entomobacter blattae]|nr:hypothetical protein [Entomobacter blattae]